MAAPVEYSLRWWVKILRTAMAEGFEDEEVRKYFGMKEGDYVSEADRRRLARHKARSMFRYKFVWTLINAVAETQKKNAYGEYSALKIDGFARFFRRDNTGRAASVPKTRLYPLMGDYGRVVGKDEMVLMVERAEVLPQTWGGVLPGEVETRAPLVWNPEFSIVFEDQQQYLERAGFMYSRAWAVSKDGAQYYISPELDDPVNQGFSPAAVWCVWVPQALRVTSYFQGTGETKDRWRLWWLPVLVDAMEVAVGELGGKKLQVLGAATSLPWDGWDMWSDPYRGVMVSEFDDHAAKTPAFDTAWGEPGGFYTANAWARCFDRQRWMIPVNDSYGNFFYQKPVWRDAWSWWSLMSEEDAAGLVAQGYTVPPVPRAEPKRRKGVSVQFDKEFIEWLNRPPETPPDGGGAAS